MGAPEKGSAGASSQVGPAARQAEPLSGQTAQAPVFWRWLLLFQTPRDGPKHGKESEVSLRSQCGRTQGPCRDSGPWRLPASEVRDGGAAATPQGCVRGAASCGRTWRAGRRHCGWKPGAAPRGARMQARPHQGRTRAVLRKLAPEASSLTGTRLGPASVGQRKKTQISGKEVCVPGWTLRI